MVTKKYKLVEMILNNYHFLQDLIEMESEINNLKSVKYQHTTSQGNYNSDKTQKAAFEKIERDEDILKVSVLVDYIEKAIEKLPDLEKKTIKKYYIQRLNWTTVSQAVHCSIRHCQRKRRNGINILSNLLYFDKTGEYYKIFDKLLADNILTR